MVIYGVSGWSSTGRVQQEHHGDGRRDQSAGNSQWTSHTPAYCICAYVGMCR